MRLLESLGLGLLLTAVVIGLLSLWLNSASGHALAQRLPRLAAILHTKSLMLLVMMLGIGLLLLSFFVTPAVAPPAAPVRTSSAPLPTKLPAAAGAVPAILPASNPPPQPATAAADRSQPVPAAQPATPLPPLPAAAATPRATTVTRAKVDAPEATPQKKNIFSARCARLLEKVGAGEPMTPQEQHEMVTKCQ